MSFSFVLSANNFEEKTKWIVFTGVRYGSRWSKRIEKDRKGNPKPFSISFVKRSTGAIVNVPSCTCTSIHTVGPTVNILYTGEEKPRSIRKCLIIKFNGKSVYQ